MKWSELFSSGQPARKAAVRDYGIAVLSVAAATAIRALLDPVLGDQFPFLFYFIALGVTASFTGLGPSVVAMVLGFLVSDWLFVPPRHVFAFSAAPELLGLALYCTLSLCLLIWAQGMRRAKVQAQAGTQAARLRQQELERLIAERQQSQEAFQRSEAQLRAFFQTAAVGLAQTDLGGRFLQVNDRFCQLTGYRREELLEKTAPDLSPPEDRARDQEQLAAYLQGRVPMYAVEKRYRRKDGTLIWVQVTAGIVRDAAGTPRLSTAIVQDITERKAAQRALQQSEQRFRALFEQNADAIFSVDPAGRFTLANAASEAISGYSITELLQKSFMDLCAPDQLANTVEVFERGIRDRTANRLETAFIRKDGQRVDLLVSGSPIVVDGQVTAIYCTAKDITEHRRAEEALRQSEQRLRLALEAGGMGSWSWDLETREVQWDKVQYALWGVDPATQPVTAELIRALVLPEDLPGLFFTPEGAIAAGPHDTEFRIRLPDGQIRWLGTYGGVICNSQGKSCKWVGVNFDITERKRAEDALRQSREQYRHLVESSGSVILRADPDMRITFMNQYGLRFFGYAPEELIGQRALGTIIPFADAAGRDIGAMAEDLMRHPGEYSANVHQNRCKDGRLVWMSWANQPIYDERGNLIEILAIGNDLSKLKEAEEALRQSEARLAEIIRCAPSFMCVLSGPEHVFELANEQYMLAVGRRDLLHRRVRDALPEVEGQGYFQILDRVFQTGVPFAGREMRVMLSRQPGAAPEERWLDFVYLPMREADGSVSGIFVHGVDLTQQVKARQRVEQSEARERRRAAELEALVQSVPAAVWIAHDPACRHITGNRVANEWLRLPSSGESSLTAAPETRPTHYKLVKDGRELHEDEMPVQMAARGVPARDFEVSLVFTDGAARHLLGNVTPLCDEQGRPRGAVAVFVDITERKEMLEALTQAQEQLRRHAEDLEHTVQERTAKLRETVAELEQFSYSITHDMRAPLRALQGFAQMLVQGGFAEAVHPLARDYLGRIMGAASRMDALIRDALQYSQAVRKEYPLRPVAVKPLLCGMLETYPNLQPPQAEISLEGEFPPVLGNEAALTQCFSNLLNNAVKFVVPGTLPRVRVWAQKMPNVESRMSNEESGAEEVRSAECGVRNGRSGKVPNAWVRIWFADNGIGIPPEYQQRIFDMFEQLDKSYEGTGIGLALVRKSTERMGGQVGVESAPGQGSRFWLELRTSEEGAAG